MQAKDTLIENIEKIHTTKKGIERITKNLKIDVNAVEYCISKILEKDSEVTRKGKNYYVNIDNCIITINSSSYTIITAHKK